MEVEEEGGPRVGGGQPLVWRDVTASVPSLADPVLVGVSGRVEHSTVCAVVGPSGGGKSTLLDCLAGRSECDVSGSLPRIDPTATAYVTQEIVLQPTSTVETVLRAYCRYCLPGATPDAVVDGHVDAALDILKLQHVRTSLVGGTLPSGIKVRGVSGGELRRVFMGCSLVRQPDLLLLDEPTTGLDSSVALDVCESLRRMAAEAAVTVVTTIHQPRREIWETFDQVYVLCKGVRVYAGPPGGVAPFLTGVLGAERDPDVSPPDFVLDNLSSMGRPEASELGDAFAKREGAEGLAANEDPPEPSSPPRQRPDWSARLRILARQRLWAISGAIMDELVVRFVIALIVSVLGCIPYAGVSSYYSEDYQSDYLGAVTYITMSGAQIASTIGPTVIDARRVFLAQRADHLYDGTEAHFAVVLIELCVLFVISFLMWLPFWGIVGLNRDASHFFFGWMCQYVTIITASSYFMLIAYMSPSTEAAIAGGSYLNNTLGVYSGFYVAVSNIPWVTRWIVYINPLYYCLSAAQQNQFSGKHVECDEYDYDECMQGDDYMSYYGFDIVGKGADIIIALVFFLFFQACGAVTLHFSSFARSGSDPASKLLDSTVGDDGTFKEPKKSGLGVAEGGGDDVGGDESAPLMDDAVGAGGGYTDSSSSRLTAPLVWRGITYEVVAGEGDDAPLKVLDAVSGRVEVGTVCAIMGPSGAGKSSLLDVLAQREMEGVLVGKLPDVAPSEVSYVTQNEVFVATETVMETLEFWAKLCMQHGTGYAERRQAVLRAARMMNLSHRLSTPVGGPLAGGLSLRGLSGGEQRRLSIACGLLRNPKLLMLDEPTSGLDAGMALEVMGLLRDLAAEQGVTVVATIHQPRVQIWRMFNKVILLVKGVKVYDGPPGGVVPHLEPRFRPKQDGENPADFALDCLAPMTSDEAAAFRWTGGDNGGKAGGGGDDDDDDGTVFGTPGLRGNDPTLDNPFGDLMVEEPRPPFHERFAMLFVRHLRLTFRNPGTYLARYAGIIVMTVLVGLAYLKLENDPYLESQSTMRVALQFVMTTQLGAINNSTLELFQKTRRSYFHERRAQIYGSTEYYLALVLADAMFFVLVISFFYQGIIYWCSSGNPDSGRVAYELFQGFFMCMVATAYFTLVSLGTPNMQLAVPLMTLAALLYQIWGGFLVKNKDMPVWCRWISVLIPSKYCFHGYVWNQFKDVHIECDVSADDDCEQGNDVVEYWGADVHPGGLSGQMGVLVAFAIVEYTLGGAVLGLLGERLRRAAAK